MPVWYQKGFVARPKNELVLLNLAPKQHALPDGRVVTARALFPRSPKSCFWAEDLYTTRFGTIINDDVERFLFGEIDNGGARAVRALIGGDFAAIHDSFQDFFEYLNAQKLRTPKGLDWIKKQYPKLTQLDLMLEMQALRQMHCTMWFESVREIVSAENATVKFIVTDHPVTVYHPALAPTSEGCNYPNDPEIELVGTQTLFALDSTHCLIMSNLEYAKDPHGVDVLKARTNARHYGHTIARVDATLRGRKLNDEQVHAINRVLKARARNYVAAGDESWLFPEASSERKWHELAHVLLPPTDELWRFGGEMYIGLKDGSVLYRDQFGRTSHAHSYLKKEPLPKPPESGDECGCGSGRRFKRCCQGIPLSDRATWSVCSIRERNLILIRAVKDILGLAHGKTWEDVRRDLSEEQVRKIYETVGALWPEDTDISALLPRPDNRTFRALFLGMVDARTIVVTAISWLAYFDEIILANPFLNPNHIAPAYNPIHTPREHKAQTLKNVFLLLLLEPFIAAGSIHLVPDPSDFNDEFRRSVWKMAQERGKEIAIPDEDAERIKHLAKDEFSRFMRALPDEAMSRQIRKAMPDIAPDLMKEVLAHMKEQHANDPLALLQPIQPGDEGVQTQISKGFNLEVALFLAQLTGSVVYTDMLVHWNSLEAQPDPGRGPERLAWESVSRRISGISFPLTAQVEIAYDAWRSNGFSEIRSAFRNTASACRKEASSVKDQVKELGSQWHRARKNIRRGWKGTAPSARDIPAIQAHIRISIRPSGFERNSVRRMLVTFGRKKHVSPMPIAMLIAISPVS